MVQFVIPVLCTTVLTLVHDTVTAGHPGKECTLTATRSSYVWPKMRMDPDADVAKCVKCAQHKGNVPRPAPILEYPPPDQP